MSDAVAQVRDSLGSDAVIIDTLRGSEQGARFAPCPPLLGTNFQNSNDLGC